MTITLGTQFEVDVDGTSPSLNFNATTIVNLTDTTAICLYSDNTDGLNARLLTLSGSTLSRGAETNITGSYARYVIATRLTNTSALLVWGIQSSTFRARILTVSGTTITANAETTLTDNNVNSIGLDTINATNTIFVYSNQGSSGAGEARILSISGTTVTENASFVFEASNTSSVSVTAITASRSIVVWGDSATINTIEAEALDISGTTITGNTSYSFSKSFPSVGQDHWLDTTRISDTQCVIAHRNIGATNVGAFVITEAATVLSAATSALLISGAAQSVVSVRLYSSTLGIAMAARGPEVAEFSISGTTITLIDSTVIVISSDGWGTITTLDNTEAIAAWHDVNDTPETTEAISVSVAVAGGLSLAPMTKPASIDASGTFIYLALLDGSNPILTKISTALDADGSTVFNPGSGSNIGVQCSLSNASVVWIAGAFDGTNVVEKSEDAGDSFTVKDDASIGNIRSFALGPDNDQKMLVFDETNDDILETKDDGASWDTINASVTPKVNTIARLGENTQESVFGNDGGASNSVNYSINSGDDLEDFQTGVYPNQDATKIIVN